MGISKSRIRSVGRTSCNALALAVAIAACIPAPGMAAASESSDDSVASFSIPAGDLANALEQFSTQSGIQVMYRQDLVAGKRARAVAGSLNPSAALARLLDGTGLVMERVNNKTYVLKKPESPGRKSSDRKGRPAPQAPAEGDSGQIDELEKIVVVGSRLGASPYDAMSMAKVIDREEIERSGASNVAQVLSYLPEVSVNNNGDSVTGTVGGNLSGRSIGFSTVQLRGLPQGTTLVLINGRRAGGSATGYNSDSFDLSTIPLGMVERVEVLPIGASAIYGGDGLAGVVNIVLRRDADGFEVHVRHMDADGYGESNAGLTYGKSWSQGRVMATATWRKTGTLGNEERNLTADADYRRFGGPDQRQSWGYPGNVYSMDGCGPRGPYGYTCFVPLAERGNLPGLDSPFATVPKGQNGQGLTPADFVGSAGTLNLLTDKYQIASPSEQFGLGLNASFDLSEIIELFTEWNLTKRKADATELELAISYGEYGFNSALVSATNPFNPFGVDVGVDYLFEDTGIFQEYEQQYWRGLVGARGKGEKWGWEVSAWQSHERSDTGDAGYFDPAKIEMLLKSTDPATALNLFTGDGSAPASPEVMNGLIAHVNDSFSATVQGINGYLRRSFQLPAGNATALIGSEYERTKLDSNPWSVSVSAFDGVDDRKAVFTEARVPILAGTDGEWQRLSMSGAARYESTGRSQGHAFTKGFELDFRPVPSLSVRANYSTAFKPLNLSSASTEPRVFFTQVLDPQFGGAEVFVPMIQTGGTPTGLKPETSSSRSLALVYATSTAKLSIMHWDNRLRNRIAYIGPAAIVENEGQYPGRVIRDPGTGQITLVDARSVNVSSTDNSGVDLGAEADWFTAYGDFTTSLNATYVYRYDERRTPTSQLENNVARWNYSGWSPRWKVVPRISWDWRSLTRATVTGRYVSSYEDPVPLSTGKIQRLGDFWQFDLNIDADISQWLGEKAGLNRQVRFNVGVNNLFNRMPDYCNACASNYFGGYDAMQYDIVGRRIYAELKLSF